MSSEVRVTRKTYPRTFREPLKSVFNVAIGEVGISHDSRAGVHVGSHPLGFADRVVA